MLRSSWTGDDAMATEMRKTGIDAVGEMPWGSHFCLFYETKQDLLETLVSYCKAGLESGEFCLWVAAEPLTVEQAIAALRDATSGSPLIAMLMRRLLPRRLGRARSNPARRSRGQFR
jgi:hypothetical protein